MRLALEDLVGRDSRLAAILERLGPPPLWRREPGFPTLVHMILEQQVSLASARAVFDRLLRSVAELTPERFAALQADELRGLGFSRQKIRYCHGLAAALLDGSLDLSKLDEMENEDVRRELVRLPGIGPWTAEVYLLMALGRPDAWPVGDLALAVAAQDVLELEERPSASELEELGEAWRPWRAVAARVLWHHYLGGV
ncbi:MAG: DNA-3-methyladenine glycosylase 2 family protein [Acidobacteriota bacterium]|nr:DNA-3-methyladenine glycosylase 2 family protein [Acidobacteriota bacterium]